MPMTHGHDLAMALRTTYLAMHRQADARLARIGITADQFVVMNALATEPALTQSALARRACSDPNTVRAMLLLLERRGLISRSKHPTDGRARTVKLTAKGRRVHESAWAAGEPLREQLATALDPRRAKTLVALLEQVREALNDPMIEVVSNR